MPLTPQLNDFLLCPICFNQFSNTRKPFTLICSHTCCSNCLQVCLTTQSIGKSLLLSNKHQLNSRSKAVHLIRRRLRANFPRMKRFWDSSNWMVKMWAILHNTAQEVGTESIRVMIALKSKTSLSIANVLIVLNKWHSFYDLNSKVVIFANILVQILKNEFLFSDPSLSRPMQRKLITLLHCQIVEGEGRTRALRNVRSIGERALAELLIKHQDSHQLRLTVIKSDILLKFKPYLALTYGQRSEPEAVSS